MSGRGWWRRRRFSLMPTMCPLTPPSPQYPSAWLSIFPTVSVSSVLGYLRCRLLSFMFAVVVSLCCEHRVSKHHSKYICSSHHSRREERYWQDLWSFTCIELCVWEALWIIPFMIWWMCVHFGWSCLCWNCHKLFTNIQLWLLGVLVKNN